MKRLKLAVAAALIITTGISAFGNKAGAHKFAGPFTYFNRNHTPGSIGSVKATLTYTLDDKNIVCFDPDASSLICIAVFSAVVVPTAGVSHPEFTATLILIGNGTYVS